MNLRDRQPVTGFMIGCVLAALAAALSIPRLPLRQSVPVFGLLAALLLQRRGHADRGRFVLWSYAWCWMIGCVALVGTVVGRGLMVIALACCVPAALAGVRFGGASDRLPVRAGVGLAALLLAGLGGMLALAGFGDPAAAWRAVAVVLGSAAACLAVRGSIMTPEGERIRGVLRVAMAGCALVLLATGMIWLFLLGAAKVLEARGDLDAALAHSRRELEWARRLDVRFAVAHALHRQSELHLAAGRAAQWRATLRDAVCADPGDHESLLALLRDAVNRAAFDRAAVVPEVLEFFRLLPDSRVPADLAPWILRWAYRERAWDAFVRAWRIGERDALGEVVDEIDPWIAGRALYFSGAHDLACRFLEAVPAPASELRQALGMLILLHNRGGRDSRARQLLEEGGDGLHPEEKQYLRGVVEGRVMAEPGVAFEKTLRLLACEPVQSIVAPGGRLALRFQWRLLAPLDPAWRVFVHVREARYGGRLFPGDHRFEERGVAPGQWPLGTRVDYTATVDVPRDAPAGSYVVLVGVWDGTRNRSAATDHGVPESLRLGSGHRVLLDTRIRVAGDAETQ